MDTSEVEFLSPKEAAVIAKVSLRTIMKWIRDGALKHGQPLGPHTKIFIARDQLSATARRRKRGA